VNPLFHSVLLFGVLLSLYQYDAKYNIRKVVFVPILSAIMLLRIPFTTSSDSVWAEDGTFYNDSREYGLDAITKRYNGYHQYGLRLIFLVLGNFPLRMLPYLVLVVCLIFYMIIISTIISINWTIGDQELNAKKIGIGFAATPLLAYETLGNINNLGVVSLIAVTCYLFMGLKTKNNRFLKGLKPRVSILLSIALTTFVASISPGLFPVIFLAFLFSIKISFVNVSKVEWIALLPAAGISLMNFILSMSARVDFKIEFLPSFIQDLPYRLIFSAYFGRYAPDVFRNGEFSLGILALLVTFLSFSKLLFDLVHNVDLRKIEVKTYCDYAVFPAVFCLFIPSAMALFAAGNFIAANDLALRWGLMGAGKFISASFAVFLVIFMANYLQKSKQTASRRRARKKKTTKKGILNFENKKKNYNVLFTRLIVFVTFIVYFVNFTSDAGRLPADYGDRVSKAHQVCVEDVTLEKADVEIAPYDGNWKIVLKC